MEMESVFLDNLPDTANMILNSACSLTKKHR